MEPELFYYSFQIGEYGSLRSTWQLKDIKIAAYNPRQAIVMLYWMDYFKNKMTIRSMTKKSEFGVPHKSYVERYIRQVIEYRVKSKVYYFRMNFTKVRLINYHELVKMFE
ncbi:MAG: hypothetical protein IPO86_09890 [Saprospiraceae bacterium]|nr:hypothetical protein [Saprospiraceae bacterium]